MVGIGFASATTVQWGTKAFSNILTSNNEVFTPEVAAEFTFAVGSFGDFEPNGSNLELWGAEWKTFDTAEFSAENGIFSANTEFLSNVDFAVGEQAYLWVYNQLEVDTDTEWFLVTRLAEEGGWTFPEGGTEQTPPEQWWVSEADTVVFGGLNGTPGPGEHGPGPVDFDVRTHTVTDPVPEVSVTLFAALGCLLGFVRRRNR